MSANHWGLCKMDEAELGLDVAKWQPNVPWAQLPGLGVRWCIVKGWHSRWRTAEGPAQYEAARAAGLVVGEYAWLEPEQSLDLQIGAWCAAPPSSDALPLAIDFEQQTMTLRGRPLVSVLERAVEIYSDRTGRRPIVYTGNWYWVDYCGNVDSQIVAECPLWFAAYPRKGAGGTRYREALVEVCSSTPPAIPRPWAERGLEPVAWQFDGDKGLYLPNGGDVDVNAAHWPRLLELVPARDTSPGLAWSPTEPPPALQLVPEEQATVQGVLDMVSSPTPTRPETPTSKSSDRLRAVREEDPS